MGQPCSSSRFALVTSYLIARAMSNYVPAHNLPPFPYIFPFAILFPYGINNIILRNWVGIDVFAFWTGHGPAALDTGRAVAADYEGRRLLPIALPKSGKKEWSWPESTWIGRSKEWRQGREKPKTSQLQCWGYGIGQNEKLASTRPSGGQFIKDW